MAEGSGPSGVGPKTPVVRRVEEVTPEVLGALAASRTSTGFLGAAALVWNRWGQVLLVRPVARPGRPGTWMTPGGAALEGESPEETVRREAREEVGLELEDLQVSKVFDLILTDGREELTGIFVQYEAFAAEGELLPGSGVAEARWFDYLPEDMAYRRDYLEAFEGRRRRSP